ncbi:MAG: hypothetical protein KDD94_09435 [Calditrichaeota bacterium]|nr:hypothetical protein [Calditrichota bacterium]
MKYLILLFLVSVCAAQQIRIRIVDKKTKEPISKAEINFRNRLYTSDEEGIVLLPQFTGRITIEVLHFNYTKESVLIRGNQEEYVVELSEKVYTGDEVVVEADRKRKVIINETEIKTKKVNISKEFVQRTVDLDKVISSLENVHLDKTINGNSNVNILGSNTDEVNFTVNQVNLFSYSNSQSYFGSLIPLSLKEVTLNLGNENNFIGTISALFDYTNKNIAMATFSEDYLDNRLTLNTQVDNLILLNSASYTISKKNYLVEDNNFEYKYPFLDNNLKLNLIQSYKYNESNFENIIVYDYKKRDYLENVNKDSYVLVSGFHYDINENFKLSNNLLLTNEHYINNSKTNLYIGREDNVLENKITAEYKAKKDIESYTARLLVSTFQNEITESNRSLVSVDKGSDSKYNLEVLYKYLPEKSAEENRVVFEFNGMLGSYNSVNYLENIGLKASIDLDVDQVNIELYSDLNINKRPLLNSQRLLMLADSSGSFLRSENLLFGFKLNHKDISFDFNYSNRSYEAFISKVYDLIFFNYVYNKNVIMKVFNGSLAYKKGAFNANASFQLLSTDNELSVFNKPKLLVTNNLSYQIDKNEFLISAKYMKDRHLTTSYNGVIYKRILDDSFILNLIYKYANLFESNLSLNVELSNLLNNSNYTVNGFNLKERDIYVSLSYSF